MRGGQARTCNEKDVFTIICKYYLIERGSYLAYEKVASALDILHANVDMLYTSNLGSSFVNIFFIYFQTTVSHQ